MDQSCIHPLGRDVLLDQAYCLGKDGLNAALRGVDILERSRLWGRFDNKSQIVERPKIDSFRCGGDQADRVTQYVRGEPRITDRAPQGYAVRGSVL